MNPATSGLSNHRPIAARALELIWLLRYLDSAEVARDAADTLVQVLPLPESPMTIITALYSSVIVHYRRIFDDRPYSEKRARDEPGFRSDVHQMLLKMRTS